jgi:hypothetical protein
MDNEVRKRMINRDAGPIVKFCIYVSLALFLCIAPSCTKAPEQPAAKTSTPPASEPGIPPTAPEKPADPGAPAVADQQKAAINDSPLVPIAIKLPKPLFIGTPQNIVLENLEKPLGKPRPPFLAPAGTSNVALGKRIASSDNSPIIGELECITDGNKDSSDGNYVQLGPGVQHITIDLGTRCEIYAIVVWHLHKQPVVFFDVIVQSADDANFIENANTLFNNDIDNSAGMGIGKNMHYTETNEGKLIDAKGIKARYVRLYSNGYSLEESNYYTEVEVYGRTIK